VDFSVVISSINLLFSLLSVPTNLDLTPGVPRFYAEKLLAPFPAKSTIRASCVNVRRPELRSLGARCSAWFVIRNQQNGKVVRELSRS
jgi:hypothetical protein